MSQGVGMPVLKSLTAKYVFVSLIVLLLISAFVAASFDFTHHMRGEAEKINKAGQLRYRSFKMAWYARKIAENIDKPRTRAMKTELGREIQEYDRLIEGLVNGVPERNINPIRHYREAMPLFDNVVQEWNRDLRPVLLKTAGLPRDVSERRARELLMDFDEKISGHVLKIDGLVTSLQTHAEAKFARFDRARNMILGSFIVGAIFIVWYFRRNIIGPVRTLTQATLKVKQGDFGVVVPVQGHDELADLGGAFNAMAYSLRESSATNAKLIRNINALRFASDAILGDLRVERLLDKVTEVARDLVGCKYAALGILDDKGGYAYYIPKGIEPALVDEMKRKFGLPVGKGLLGYLIKEGEPVRIDDISKHPASIGFSEGHPPMKAFLGVPVILRKEVIGRLYFTDKVDGAAFTQEDEDLALSFAGTVALAINNARILSDISSKNIKLDILNTIGRASSESLTLDVLAGRILDAVLSLESLTLEKKGAIFINDMDTKTLKLVSSRNFGQEQIEGCGTVPYGECLCGIAAREEQTVLSNSNTEDKRHSKVYRDAKEHGHVILPLKSRDKMLGVLCLYLPAVMKSSDEELRLYASIADIISVAIQNALSHQQVAVLAQSLDSSGDLVVITDLEGRITHVNPQVQLCLGYTQQELMGKNVSVIQSPRNRQGLGAEIYQKTLEGGWQGEVIYIRKDGSEYPVILSAAPVRGESGDVIALIGIARDITERKQVEETIKRYNDELLALADASNVVLVATTTKKLYETICEIVVRNFSLKMAWLGLVVKDSYDVKPAGQYGFDEGYLENIKITWDDSPSGMGPTGMAIKTKTAHIVNDIQTDARFALWKEKAVKRGFRSSLAAPMLTSEGGVIGTINLYCEEAHFFTPQRKKLFQVFANQAATAVENARLVKDLEKKVLKRTQEFETANRQLLTMNEELVLRRSEADTAKIQADAANRAKSDFLANMSHELRTPLNAIIGFSDIMINGLTGPLTDEQMDFTRDIGKSGKHLLTLINDILDLSKVEAGKMELEPGTVHVQELIERSLVMFKEKAMRHRINVDYRVADGITDITADEMKLKQVLVNLLSNAFKYTPDGGSVRVAARKLRGSEVGGLGSEVGSQFPIPDLVEFSVTDTGPGIKAEDIPKLFQPFQQLETTLTKKIAGTGLGLNLCKKFVEMHGGKIWVESEVGKGSTFSFVISEKMGADHSSKKQSLTWDNFLKHIDRFMSFHKRKKMQFGVVCLKIIDAGKSAGHLTIMNAIKETLRHHEIIVQGENANTCYIVLLASDRRMAKEATERLKEALSSMDCTADFRTALYPDDGETIEELLLRVS